MKVIAQLSVVFTLFFLIACNYSGMKDTNTVCMIENKIINNTELLIEAATQLDMDSILSFYDKKLTAIEQGHMHASSNDFIANYRNALRGVDEVHKIEIVNPRVQVLSEQVAICEVKLIQDITLKSGDRIEAVNVLTLVYALKGDVWKIVHHHGSYPV